MFLMTNRVKDFDDAMQSRIYLAVRYPALSVNTRKDIRKSFLEKTVTIKREARLRAAVGLTSWQKRTLMADR